MSPSPSKSQLYTSCAPVYPEAIICLVHTIGVPPSFLHHATSPASHPAPRTSVSPSPSNWDHDGVVKAAESLAKFFSGEIIRMTDDSFQLSDSVSSVETPEIYESYVDDEYN